jgi:hypothetical protein
MKKIVFVPTPVSEKPPKDGWYVMLNANMEILARQDVFKDGQWCNYSGFQDPYYLLTVEVTNDSPVQKIIDRFEKLGDIANHPVFYGASEEAKKHLSADLARSAHIQQLEQEVQRLRAEREKIASDAWDAAENWIELGGVTNYPNKETYLKSLKYIIMEKKTGVQLIAEERNEQINKHGFSVTEDAEYYQKMELIQAALFCIDQVVHEGFGLKTYKTWPSGWQEKFMHKIMAKDDIGKLKVAGAFIAAEIDRILESLNTQS